MLSKVEKKPDLTSLQPGSYSARKMRGENQFHPKSNFQSTIPKIFHVAKFSKLQISFLDSRQTLLF